MSEYGIDENMWKLNGSNNQLKNFLCDDMISTNIDNYYKTKSDLFYKRSNTLIYSDPVISYGQLELLGNIFNILKVHNSEYKVIISPLYNQKKIAIEDLEHLREIFGEKHVFDFSGINKFTSDYKNYYEDSHYRPIVANEILKFLYFSTNPM